MTGLPEPVGDLHTVWKVNPNRYNTEPDYRAAVEQLLARHTVGGSVNDAEVLTDDAGHLVLTTMTYFDADGDFRRGPAGRPAPGRVMAALDPEEVLP